MQIISHKILFGFLLLSSFITSCRPKTSEMKDEQIHVDMSENNGSKDSITNSIHGNISFQQMITYPNSVLMTGMSDHRLVPIYQAKKIVVQPNEKNILASSYWSDYNSYDTEMESHFMPGIDILFGYKLLNIAHYNLKSEQFNYLFTHPVLIKTLYYPSSEPDSISKKPVYRNYYLMSVYDEDTNKDTLINRKDLRRFYHFDSSATKATRILPADQSVVRSQYDKQNDVMYLYTKQDTNKNGLIENKEPIHIFWIKLSDPNVAKRLF
jgi:hypothetical protein